MFINFVKLHQCNAGRYSIEQPVFKLSYNVEVASEKVFKFPTQIS